MNKKRVALLALVVVIIVAAIAGWRWYAARHTPLTLYGNVDIRTVNLSFRVSGRLASLAVDEGDAVRAGQPLGDLDPTPQQNALRQAQANVAAARAKYDLTVAGFRDEEIAQAAAAVHQAQAAYDYAQNFYQRQQGLWRTKVISANDLENARSARDQAQAELAQAQLNAQDTRLVSPSDGTILTRAVEPGSMLNAGSTVFTLSLTRPVWIRAYIDEVNLGRAVPGSHILIYTDGRPDKPYHGQIGFVSPTAEFTPKTVETEDLRTDLVYRLRIVVNDADDALRQGMPVTLRFQNEAADGNR
ncbi:HlyD family secretion protein [Cronobacter sakazakii]|uniref:HlyD family secretion protein n=1 Tax=Cronobacter sakazakii TaxID=28141 RepID=UPI000A20121F|nr:HlyD family secretion protein [Cronobacter sakazakii]PUY29404.1 secretion protein HlyD [Cronobacter sakazakii]